MDQAFFTLKRAHHATLKYSRDLLAEFGVTPARFDYLQAIAMGDCTQFDLRTRLGLAKGSISEMLGELERIGLVSRMRCQRTKALFLERKGLRVFRRVLVECIRKRRVSNALRKALARVRGGRTHLATVCWYLRDRFGDNAESELYPGWYPSGFEDELREADE